MPRRQARARRSAVLFSVLMAIPIATAGVSAEPGDGLQASSDGLQRGETFQGLETDKFDPQGAELVPVVIKLDVAPVASYRGGVRGLAGTQQLLEGGRADGAARQSFDAYEAHVEGVQRTFERRLTDRFPEATIGQRLTWVVGGVSAAVPADRVAAISRMAGVDRVMKDDLHQLLTDASPEFIGAPTTWNELGGQDDAGEGVIVGVLDTGIWPEHDSVSDPDPTGEAYAAPPAPVSGTRDCEFSGGTNPGDPFTCNNKLIGADRFMTSYDLFVGLEPEEFSSARDDNGHGTHTLTTSAGNREVESEIFGVDRGTLSGIAPRAHAIMYKVCGDGGCFSSDSAAAVQEAIQDGVDVINFSISGGGDPYNDVVSLAFLDAYNSGLFVSASAGNSGPGPDTVAHREPWTTTVGASTSDRHFLTDVTLTSDDGPDLELVGASVTAGVGPFPLVIADDVDCLDEGPDNDYEGQIVLCRRSPPARVTKSYAVGERGGEGMIPYNPTVQGLNTDNHFIPSAHVEADAGTAILDYLDDYSNVQASWPASVPTEVPGDEVAPFSSRGGPAQTLGISKPDVTAPGVQILAGHTPEPATPFGGLPGQLFQAIAGTSMSSPHVAGAAALLADLHPDWTPGQIKSALMTTGRQKVYNADASLTTPFDDGSGRINLKKAWNPGITFSVEPGTYEDYEDNQHELYRTNYPSVYVPDMPGKVTVARLAHNELTGRRSWTTKVSSPDDMTIKVAPVLTIDGGSTRNFNITIDASTVPLGEVRHGQITFKHGSIKARIPVTIVRGEAPISVDKECDPTVFPRSVRTTCTIEVANTTLEDAIVSIKDKLPARLQIAGHTVQGAELNGNGVRTSVMLSGAEPADVDVAPGDSPFGYIPLAGYSSTLVAASSDESITNYNVPAFEYAGEIWSQIGFVSNGYAIVGGGTGADVDYINTNLPNPAIPNNVLAPFWTDLRPGSEGGGRLLINVLSAGGDSWIILEWEAVENFGDEEANSFQIWIGVDGDANSGQDISFTYGAVSDGDGGFLTVGAENKFGNRGDVEYFDGLPVGGAPTNAVDYLVTSTPGSEGELHTIKFKARGMTVGDWTNCAVVWSDAFYGRGVDCESGTVTAPN